MSWENKGRNRVANSILDDLMDNHSKDKESAKMYAYGHSHIHSEIVMELEKMKEFQTPEHLKILRDALEKESSHVKSFYDAESAKDSESRRNLILFFVILAFLCGVMYVINRDLKDENKKIAKEKAKNQNKNLKLVKEYSKYLKDFQKKKEKHEF